MSEVSARAALETRLLTLMPEILTADENVNFEPPASGVPYQRLDMLRGAPDNPEIGSGYQMRGILQVSLFYPLNEGSGPATARAELIRALFPRGLGISHGGLSVIIETTPEIRSGSPDGDRYMVPVRIRWFANRFS